MSKLDKIMASLEAEEVYPGRLFDEMTLKKS